uniref:Uncharacterized protein n=1 Tax=Aegilops tauschii subsp. strangulata TaxID=200361 RepID=A0A453JP00_AEGTS
MVCRVCLSPCYRESRSSDISMYVWEFKNAGINQQPVFFHFFHCMILTFSLYSSSQNILFFE